jgi:hypothetical protein
MSGQRTDQRSGQRAGFNFTGPFAGLGNSILHKFGVKTAEREKPKSPDRQYDGPVVETHAMPLPTVLWLGARLPFAAFVTIFAFFTYLYHIVPIVPWICAFFCLVFAVIVCWPPKYIGTKRRSFWDWGAMYSWCIAIGLAVCLGHINYGILESWINTTFLREYKHVKANTDPKAVMDAGILNFDKDVILDTSMSAGYKFWFFDYCAAPIVGSDPQAFPVHYWAVGVGCCDSRGGFKCDSAADKSAHKAVPLRPHSLGPEITEHYNTAVRMAAAANDLQVAKEPVFVMWHKDPKEVGEGIWWFCTMFFIISTLIALCACCACQSGYTHISVMQQH